MKLMFLLVVVVLAACSRINPQERAEYNRQKIRHGIVPISGKVESVKSQAPVTKLDQLSIERGKQLYQNHCISCHGDKGIGDGSLAQEMEIAPANLHKTVKEVDNFEFYMSISQWQGQMPGWQHPFSHQDRVDLANYIKTFRHN